MKYTFNPYFKNILNELGSNQTLTYELIKRELIEKSVISARERKS